jgi:hypothetical protein
MVDESNREDAARAMRQINQAWLEGEVQDLAPIVHSEIVMVIPGFAGRIQGREDFLAGFLISARRTMLSEATITKCGLLALDSGSYAPTMLCSF